MEVAASGAGGAAGGVEALIAQGGGGVVVADCGGGFGVHEGAVGVGGLGTHEGEGPCDGERGFELDEGDEGDEGDDSPAGTPLPLSGGAVSGDDLGTHAGTAGAVDGPTGAREAFAPGAAGFVPRETQGGGDTVAVLALGRADLTSTSQAGVSGVGAGSAGREPELCGNAATGRAELMEGRPEPPVPSLLSGGVGLIRPLASSA